MRRIVLAVLLLLGAAVLTAQSWSAIGPPGGELDFVAIAPSNPTTVYASSRFGGVFRSNNGATSWDPTIEGLPTAQDNVPDDRVVALEEAEPA